MLYAVVLIILATAGILYCVKLKNNADPEKVTSIEIDGIERTAMKLIVEVR